MYHLLLSPTSHYLCCSLQIINDRACTSCRAVLHPQGSGPSVLFVHDALKYNKIWLPVVVRREHFWPPKPLDHWTERTTLGCENWSRRTGLPRTTLRMSVLLVDYFHARMSPIVGKLCLANNCNYSYTTGKNVEYKIWCNNLQKQSLVRGMKVMNQTHKNWSK